MSDVPKMYSRGTLYEYSEESSFWKFCTVGNYIQLAWKYMFPDVQGKQQQLEKEFMEGLGDVDEKAAKLIGEGKMEKAVKLMTDYSNGTADTIFDAWGKLLHMLFAKFHDGYQSLTSTSTFDAAEFFYPRWWLRMSNFFVSVIEDHGWEPPSDGESLEEVFPPEKLAKVLEIMGDKAEEDVAGWIKDQQEMAEERIKDQEKRAEERIKGGMEGEMGGGGAIMGAGGVGGGDGGMGGGAGVVISVAAVVVAFFAGRKTANKNSFTYSSVGEANIIV